MNDKESLAKIGIQDQTFDFLTVAQLVKRGIIEKPLDGNHGEIHPKGEDFVVSGIPFIMASDINDGVVNYICCKFIARKQADSLRKGFAKNGDVLLTHKATIGRTAIVKYDDQPYVMLTPQVTYYRVSDHQKLNHRYLRYYFESSFFQNILNLWAGSGSTRAYLGITEQGKLPFVLPPINKQKKIAIILSAYDELIENNQRRIALLEKMAEEIYREWFVRLRFPDHDNVKVVKGVPEGWEVRTLSSFASEIKKSVKKKNLSDDEIYIGLEHIPRCSISIKEWATADTVESDKLLFQERDILFCKIRPYLHKVALSHVAGACSSDTIVIRPKNKIYEGYLLFTVFSDTFIELATVASKGTKMPRADWGFLKKLELAVPNTQLLEAYQAQFDTLFSQIVNLLKANEALVTSRNMLLPRLISGKLSVENLDIQFPPGMKEAAHEA